MFSILVEKELKTIIQSPRFVATFLVCSILILLSLVIGIQDYKAAVKQYQAGTQLNEQQMREKDSWMQVNNRIFREPDPLHIFVSGVNNDVGRFSLVNDQETVKLTNSIYSEDPVYAVFRFLDLGFIVQIVLSLFAILFTYDAINGERENGTLRLAFSNAIPRFQYIFAKLAGAWLGLVVPLLVPLLLGLLLVVIFKIPMTSQHWLKLIFFLGTSLLYFTFFMVLGIFVSAITRRSSVSFLILLVSWITSVLILPRVGIMLAGKMAPVPSVAEIDSQIDGYAKEQQEIYFKSLMDASVKRNQAMNGLSKEEREAWKDEHMWEWAEENDNARKEMQAKISEFTIRLNEDLQNRKAVQERLAFAIARISPVSAFQLSAMNLAGTDIGVKNRYINQINQYRPTFLDYTQKKQKKSEGPGGGGIRIEFNSDTGFNFSFNQKKGGLDLSGLPRFQPIQPSLNEIFNSSVLDFGLLVLFTMVALFGAIVGFVRYDVR